jgi:hypothetical protein
LSNALLTPTAVTRKALAILHSKLNFIGSVDRQYDKSFARSGAKIGDTLKVRRPNKYVTRTGRVMDVQDTDELSANLTVGTQMGVDVAFTSVELSLSLDDFAERILEPAMDQLASTIEGSLLSSIYKKVPYQVLQTGALTYDNALEAGQILTEHLASRSARSNLLNPQQMRDLVNGTSTLFNNQTAIGRQYLDGMMGRAAGFDFFENTLMPRHLTGAAAGYLVNGVPTAATNPYATQTIAVDTGTGSWNAGDVFTIAGVYEVHPETKAVTARLQQFAVQTATTGNATTITFTPSLVLSGARQNVSALPLDDAVITRSGAASSYTSQGLAFQKEAVAFVTADLVMPDGVDWKAREQHDGISMRIVRAYDINNDLFPARIDVLWGSELLQPELIVREASNQVAA